MFFDNKQRILICDWEDIVPDLRKALSFKDVSWIHIQDPDRLIQEATLVIFREGIEESMSDDGVSYRGLRCLKNRYGELDDLKDFNHRAINKAIAKMEKGEKIGRVKQSISSRFDLLDL